MKQASKYLLAGAITGATFLGAAGGTMLSSLGANAATDTASTATTTAATTATLDTASGTPPQHDPSQGGHMANGKTETLLTGDTAEKVKSAALAALPGATINRVETDADGDTYEAHVTKSDGTQATVKLDANFKVTNTDGR